MVIKQFYAKIAVGALLLHQGEYPMMSYGCFHGGATPQYLGSVR